MLSVSVYRVRVSIWLMGTLYSKQCRRVYIIFNYLLGWSHRQWPYRKRIRHKTSSKLMISSHSNTMLRLSGFCLGSMNLECCSKPNNKEKLDNQQKITSFLECCWLCKEKGNLKFLRMEEKQHWLTWVELRKKRRHLWN